jgi:hypothetical protein
MGWGRRWVVLVGVVVALAAGTPSPASAQRTGGDAVAECRASVGDVPQLGERACRTVDVFLTGFANACRNLGLNSPCFKLDGRRTGAGHMATYAASWTHRALTLQRQLDDDVPLARSTLPHTHNSFNSSVYSPTLTNQDPNQLYSMRDQLDMDVRAIEMDVHWVPSVFGTAATKKHAVVLCHGEVMRGVHVGCTIDRPFREGLRELRQWLTRPENAHEVVLLYLENALDNSRQAHNLAADDIARELGTLVARPPTGRPCAAFSTQTTPAQLRAAGHRVLIVGNCGPGRWGTWVHERGPSSNWEESGSGPGNDYRGIQNCAAERARTRAGTAVVRWTEDVTWISALEDGDSGALTRTEAAAMARCGVTLIGFDFLTPEDPRLAAVVWSWAPNEPRRGAPPCATSGADTRFHATDCGAAHNFACMVNPDAWRVTNATGAFARGAAACAREFPGSTFAVPANGWENSLVRAAAGSRSVWLNYSHWPDV